MSSTDLAHRTTGAHECNVADAVADMKASGEPVPEALAEKKFSGRFMVRIPSSVHRALATEAAEQGLSINRLVSAKLTV